MARCFRGSVLLAVAAPLVPACGRAANEPSAPSVVAPAIVDETTSTPPEDASALHRLDEGERTIEVAAGDCARACEGLDEMTNARIALCAPRTSACEDAERREGAAKKKVASDCEPCR